MTIEEKIDNFCKLLLHSYQAQKKERIVINSEIIEIVNGFNFYELKDIICPTLLTDGLLKEMPNFLRVSIYGENFAAEPITENRFVIKSAFGYEFVVNKDKLLKKTRKEEQKNTLKSIHLVSKSITANDTIFLVLDERWETPIKFSVWSKGVETAIKKLHNLAYPANAPNKRVEYSKNLANSINNGLFKKPRIKRYLETNNFDKSTIVRKSRDGNLVLSGEIPVIDFTFEQIPSQFRATYIEKTK